MIRDLSLTLQAILDDAALATAFPELAAAQIMFDRPGETFTPAQTTINLFLYDIRENMALRSNEPTLWRHNGQVDIHRPARRIACSYLITAWPVGGADLALQEHRLLSQVLHVLARYPKIPPVFLKGQLVGQEPPLPMLTAYSEGIKEPADFWTAIGNKLRPSLTVTVTIGMEVFAPVTAPLVLTEEIRLGERMAPYTEDHEAITLATQQRFFRIAGSVTEANQTPLVGALVTLVGTGFAAQTGADGTYTLHAIPAGTYTLRVQVGATIRDVAVTIPASAGSAYNVQV